MLSEAGSGTGIGDVALNFRYQLAGDGGEGLHVAPRATLLLPTGDERRGRGAGGVGFQANLPLSVRPAPRLALHGNAGLTYTPNATNASGQSAATLGLNLGGSAIWLLRPTFNLLLELLWLSTEEVAGPGRGPGTTACCSIRGCAGRSTSRAGSRSCPARRTPSVLAAAPATTGSSSISASSTPSGTRLMPPQLGGLVRPVPSG